MNGLRLAGWLEAKPQQLGGFSYWRLALVSALGLFLEMLMIRWVSSEARIFSYFKNLVLVACFLGFGLGYYRCRRNVQVMALVSPLLLLTILFKVPISQRLILAALPRLLGDGTEVHIWGVPALPTNGGALVAVLIIVFLFIVIATTFIPFGQLVGWYLESAPNGVTAYSVNVFFSLVGIAAYTLMCFLYQPPWVWLLIAGGLSLVLFRPCPRVCISLGITFGLCSILLALPGPRGEQVYWSPYQKLTVIPIRESGQIVSYDLLSNDDWHQSIVNLSSDFVRSHPKDFAEHPVEWNVYNLPYRFYPSPPSVLVLGSGMGNDVAAASRNGAGRIVAVEIDPLILKLGRELHFEHPYESSRVQVVVDDARSYLENSHEKFDLIVFSLLDSHTTASHFSNIRIDNYVYTREALRKAKNLLKPDGLLVMKFWVETPWISGRLFGLMKDEFGFDPVQFQSKGRFLIAGSLERLGRAIQDPTLAAYIRMHSDMPMQPATLTTDDWPYFYQHEPGLPLSVILVSGAVLAVFGWFLLQTTTHGQSIDPYFMLLGAGFMLLEVQIVSKMALLFGTTWMVNSVVVAGILCLILAANFVYGGFPHIPLSVVYAGLFFPLVIMFAVPRKSLFFESMLVRATVATLVLCAPVFFAGLIFISSLATAKFSGSALGANLFGALLGGLLENLSLWFGLRSLTIIAALLYLASAVFLRSRSRLPRFIATPRS